MNEEAAVLPMLRKLQLLQLQSLVSFCPSDYLFKFPSSFIAIIEDCPNLTTCFTVDAKTLKLAGAEAKKLSTPKGKCFLDLTELKVKSCGVQEVFQLKNLPLPTTSEEYQCFCSLLRTRKRRSFHDLFDSYKTVSLKDLTTLELSKCKRLKHIFAATLAQSLPQLKHLSIWECEDLEQIIANGSSRGHIEPATCFCSLNKIDIRSCNKMKSLFPVSVALPKLEIVTIKGGLILEKLFGYEDEDAINALEEKEVVLPRLQTLDLLQLPSLSTYCPSGYQLVTPKLSSSIVEGCPKLTIYTFTVKKSQISVDAKT